MSVCFVEQAMQERILLLTFCLALSEIRNFFCDSLAVQLLQKVVGVVVDLQILPDSHVILWGVYVPFYFFSGFDRENERLPLFSTPLFLRSRY